MREIEVTDHGDGHYTLRVGGFADSGEIAPISGIIAYALALIGCIIMLCNVPSTMLFPAILAVLVLVAPIVIKLGGGASILAALMLFARYGHYMFALLLVFWWTLYTTQSAGPALLIGLGVVSMYAMYYFPFLLYADCVARDFGKLWCRISPAFCFVGSLVFYVAVHDSVLEHFEYVNVIFSTAVTVIGLLLLAVHRLIDGISEGNAHRGLVSLLLTVAILLGAALSVGLVFPKMAGASYEDALAMIERGEYREARERLHKMKNNEEAQKTLKEIAFVALEVGESVTLGFMPDVPDTPYDEVPLTWTVVAVEDGRALLFCDEILSCLDTNPLSRWNEGNNVRGELERIYGRFSEEDKARILLSTMTTLGDTGEFTAEDHLFLLSPEELLRYCPDEKALYSKEVSSYYEAQKAFETVKCYYLRGVNENNKWLIADCKNKEITYRKSEEYRLAGVRPAVYVAITEAPSE